MERFHNVFKIPAGPLEVRHQPSGLNSQFNDSQLSFAEYVACNRDMLRMAHTKLGSSDLDRVVDGNAPFELKPSAGAPDGQQKPYRRGVLLTHGLTGSPYFMRQLAVFFQENGFRVMAVLLPGHGTQPGDLLDVRWREWSTTVAYGANKLAEEVDEVYLAGYSVGATLSALHSFHDSRVRGLFLFSPAIKITSRAAFASIYKLYSWLIPAGKWLEIMPDRDIYKYESFARNAAVQAYQLIRNLKTQLQLRDLNMPIFAAASEDDETVEASATIAFMARARHSLSKLVLYTTDTEKARPGFTSERLELVDSVVPEQRILSSSHMGIVLPADEAHYGFAGDYSNCIHYFSAHKEKYQVCMNNPATDLQGELTEQNLKSGILRRLMYNPKFDALKTSMRRFIESLP